MAQRDYVLALGVDLRQQHGRFVGLRAAVGEERLFQSTRRDLRQLLRQTHLRLVGVERRHMLNLMGLLVDRLGYFVVAMADADSQNTAEEIQETPYRRRHKHIDLWRDRRSAARHSKSRRRKVEYFFCLSRISFLSIVFQR